MSKHKEKNKERSRSRSKSRERRERKKSKKSKDRRSRSRERRHKRSRSRSRSRSTSSDRRRQERREQRERELREKEMEKERLREIAIEFRQSGVFNSLAQQAQGQPVPLLSLPFPSLGSNFSMGGPGMAHQPQFIQEAAPPPKEPSRAYMEALAASQRIIATRNFSDMVSNNNSNDSASNGPPPIEESIQSTEPESAAARRERKRKSRWGGGEADKTFIPGMPTILPSTLDPTQQEAYLVQLQIEECSRKLRTGELGIPPVEERSPSPEPIYSSDGKRLNTREFRTRKRLEEQRHQLIVRMQGMNPEFKPPADYKAPIIRVSDKVLIPQEDHPDINFVGLLIGPRGNTLKAMEKDTGAKIIIRGKGSVKEGKVGRKDGQPLPGEDEPLHAFITAATADCVKKAVERINEVIKQGIEVPEGHNDLRRMQLRELAQLNGTLRENDAPRCTNCGSNDHKSWLCPDKPNVTNNIVCTSCGGAGHIAKDCKAKRPGHGGAPTEDGDPGASASNIDEEYLSLMAELGEGPPPTSEKPRNERHHERRNPFSMFDRNAAPKAIAAAPPPPPMNAVPPPPSHQMSVPPVPPPNYAQPIPPPPQFTNYGYYSYDYNYAYPGTYQYSETYNYNSAEPITETSETIETTETTESADDAMPPPPPPPSGYYNQPQIPGTDLPPIPGGSAFVPPPPPPGTHQWNAPLPSAPYPSPWSNGSGNFIPPPPLDLPPPPPPDN